MIYTLSEGTSIIFASYISGMCGCPGVIVHHHSHLKECYLNRINVWHIRHMFHLQNKDILLSLVWYMFNYYLINPEESPEEYIDILSEKHQHDFDGLAEIIYDYRKWFKKEESLKSCCNVL